MPIRPQFCSEIPTVQSKEQSGNNSKIILLDRTLADYGPKTKEIRDLLRSSVVDVIDRMGLKKSPNPTQWRASTHQMDSLYEEIRGLSPENDTQRSIQSEALSILREVRGTRWLMYEQESASISIPMLIILFSWLITLFISFGLFAPANGTVVISLLVSRAIGIWRDPLDPGTVHAVPRTD